MSLEVDHIRAVLSSEPAVSVRMHTVGNYQLHREALASWFSTQDGLWSAYTVILGCLAVFGWMPTIFEGRTPRGRTLKLEEAEKIADALREDKIANIPFDFVNHSSVGTSKFLHFWRPHLFPIWDLNVSVALFGDMRRREKAHIYRQYRDAMLQIAEADDPAVQGRQLLENEQRLFWLGKDIVASRRIASKGQALEQQRDQFA